MLLISYFDEEDDLDIHDSEKLLEKLSFFVVLLLLIPLFLFLLYKMLSDCKDVPVDKQIKFNILKNQIKSNQITFMQMNERQLEEARNKVEKY